MDAAYSQTFTVTCSRNRNLKPFHPHFLISLKFVALKVPNLLTMQVIPNQCSRRGQPNNIPSGHFAFGCIGLVFAQGKALLLWLSTTHIFY